MIWRVEIRPRPGVFDALGRGIAKDIADLGFAGISDVRVAAVYHLEGDLAEGDIRKACGELLADPITQEYDYSPQDALPLSDEGKEAGSLSVEIAYNPGVTDPVEASVIKGMRDLGIDRLSAVRTARRYRLYGTLAAEELDVIVNKILSNKLIQHAVPEGALRPKTFGISAREEGFSLRRIDLIDAPDRRLGQISREGQLFLNLDEMRAIQRHFRQLKRNPTDCELETIAQTWSEHCYHKTFRGDIRYCYQENGRSRTLLIRNLLKSTIVRATNEMNKPWCVSVFHDNAGVIKFDRDTHVCFKVETHNHPSALEPFGGANTGVGGVIRDILGTGRGARPVCSTDVFCFAPPDMSFDQLPPGTLHPKRIMKGVVSGVRDYGNKMGIPTVNGAIAFDKGFVGNPLVYCGTVGILPRDKVRKGVKEGDLIVVVGGRTGRDGIHGATFSSGELTDASGVVSSGAVQIGDPIQEKKVLDALLQARDKNFYRAITDCGAGGLSSAVGEMGRDLGARVELEKVPLKYQGLRYDEIWISESQERMVLAVPPENRQALLDVFAGENVEATVIGEFTTVKKPSSPAVPKSRQGGSRLELFFKGEQVCDLDMGFLHGGIPRVAKEACWRLPKIPRVKIPQPVDLNAKLLEVLSHYNVCSREWIIRQYDHEVQGGSVIKPLAGARCDGPSDASVLTPRLGSVKGIAVANGINVRYGRIDPYWMAASCIDEAVRQIIAVGGSLERIALLDNFCWGNPDKPDRLGGLVRAAQGCYKTAVGYQVPFISGKDSLYNEYAQGKKSMAIPGTLLISAIGIIDDVTKSVTMDLKEPGNLIYCIGQTRDELGGSVYLDTFGLLGSAVPQVDVRLGRGIFAVLTKAVRKGLIRSLHDCSEGGMGVALAEMAFSGGWGVTAHLVPMAYEGKERRNDIVFFSESNSRLIVEVEPGHQKAFERLLKGVSFGLIGRVEESPEYIVHGLDEEVCVRVPVDRLKEAWQRPLRW